MTALVLVSHSARLAEGLAELAGQMAPDVAITGVGGIEGELGTDFAAVHAALEACAGEVAVLYDLGSARMTAELAIESLAEPDRVALVEAPFVEGAVAAAVAAQGGAGLRAVLDAAVGAGTQEESAAPAGNCGSVERAGFTAELVNEIGLHARPAAAVARAVAGLDAHVTVTKGAQRADAASVLGLLGLDARKGDSLTVTADGADATRALEAVRGLIESGFGES
ncbi:dihydroxyacetone kinase phosphoryl donor subunit DhaM [Sciscionella sediminilitoris]|uniref:dihydroxyacetone kinase phosphoryl donor subunit DhaM n=1 Tax=Sciscionella sediminilitoris TaxID=1445613 RepID=UPI0004DEDAB1|nr:dihydroxyacetone kinase phosphoryl donor subunit DhaM [Sciscionella sp. SE31]